MKIFLFMLAYMAFHHTVYGQSIVARMEYVFLDDENEGKYSGGIDLKEGQLNASGVYTIIDDGNHTIKVKVLSIKDYDTDKEVKVLSKGKSGFLIIQTIDAKKIPNIIGGFTFGDPRSKMKDSKSAKQIISTTCFLDSKKWDGCSYYKSSSYFPKGNPLLKTNQPYLIVSFRASAGPDDRQLTLISPHFKAGKGVLPVSTFEIAVSGHSLGKKEASCIQSNWKNGIAHTKHTEFYFEFLKWEDIGDHIIASGKYWGKLYGFNLMKDVILCDNIDIKEGVFNDIIIEKY